MLKEEQKKFLEDNLGMNIEQLQTALTSEDEVEISFKAGTFLAEDDLNDLKSRVKSEGYNEGVVVGAEKLIKKGREKFGLEFEGKNLDNFAEAFKGKILSEAKIEPEKKVRDLSERLERLQSTYDKDVKDRESKIADYENRLKSLSINEKLIGSAIPKDLTGLTPKDFLVVAQSRGLTFDYDDSGEIIPFKNGKPILDNLEKPVPANLVLTNLADQNGWLKSETHGRGGGHSTGSGTGEFKSMNDVFAYMEKNKINPMSSEGQKLVSDFANKD